MAIQGKNCVKAYFTKESYTIVQGCKNAVEHLHNQKFGVYEQDLQRRSSA